MMNIPTSTAYIYLSVLEDNYRLIKSKLPAGTGILGVVKADAYGHGAVNVSHQFEELGVRYLGVATLEEGLELRAANVRPPTLVMSGLMPWEEVELFERHDLTPVIHDFATLRRIRKHVEGSTIPFKIHLKFDTGMGRLGFMKHDAPLVIEEVRGMKNLLVEGLMSHFASSERRDDYGIEQIKSFGGIVELFREKGIEPTLVHMANSGAIISYPEAHFDMVRVGISLYGSHSSPELKKKLPTQQVMKLVSRIAFVREFPAGCPLSYGGTFTTTRETRVAYIPVGYGDGFPRALSNKGKVLIKDRQCSIVGRICMDWILADITEVENAEVQDGVVLLGRDDANVVTADEIAEIAGTIPYEILCHISQRIKRVYV